MTSSTRQPKSSVAACIPAKTERTAAFSSERVSYYVKPSMHNDLCRASLVGINPAGAMTGAYFEPISNFFGGNYRGFLRAKDGNFTTFDAVPSPSSPCCTWTFGVAINPAGEIAGFDNDYNAVDHGFVRARDGTITILDAPGAGTGFFQGTFAFSINPAGQVAGQYIDANNVFHGFLWSP